MSTSTQEIPELVKVSDIEAFRELAKPDIDEPKGYIESIDRLNKHFKDVPHYCDANPSLMDPILISLYLHHVDGTCRLGHEPHEVWECLKKQQELWFQRMEDLAEKQQIKYSLSTKVREELIDELPKVYGERAAWLLSQADPALLTKKKDEE